LRQSIAAAGSVIGGGHLSSLPPRARMHLPLGGAG